MIRREPTRNRSVSDVELGIAAMLLLVTVFLTVLVVPLIA